MLVVISIRVFNTLINKDGGMEVILAGDKIYAIRGTDGS